MLTWNNTKPFIVPLQGGQVIKVYDGDTITIASSLPLIDCDEIFRFQVRLRGIDSPEIRSRIESEKRAAVTVKEKLTEKLLGKTVRVHNVSTEKYGRLLADVYLGDLHINDWMVQNKYAVPYDGKARRTPDCWQSYLDSK
jgi:micrococcal nuclease